MVALGSSTRVDGPIENYTDTIRVSLLSLPTNIAGERMTPSREDSGLLLFALAHSTASQVDLSSSCYKLSFPVQILRVLCGRP